MCRAGSLESPARFITTTRCRVQDRAHAPGRSAIVVHARAARGREAADGLTRLLTDECAADEDGIAPSAICRSGSADPEESVAHTSSAQRLARTTRGTRSSLHSSIAETDQESATDGGNNSPISSDDAEEANRTRSTTYSYSLSRAVRSPYVTRSTSKTRSQQSVYQRSNAAQSPTKTLKFNEGEEDVDESGVSPSRRRNTNGAVPPTPGQIEAHGDADVYAEDCCDHHDVTRLGRHSHGHTHKHLPRPKLKSPSPPPRPAPASSSPSSSSTSSSSVPARRPASSSTSSSSSTSTPGVWWKVLLALLLTSLAGPWVLRHFTERQPGFVVTPGQHNQGGIITQADLNKIIAHVEETMRKDLARGKYVTEPRLAEATDDLSQRLVSERNKHVSSAVNDALRQVDAKLAQALSEENIEDASTLSAVRAELLKIIDERTGKAMKEWSEKILLQLEKELASEKSTRNSQLQSLLAEVKSLRAEDAAKLEQLRSADAASAAKSRSSLKEDVMTEIARLFSEEQTEDRSVADAFEEKLKKLFGQENEEDAETMKRHLAETRTEFQTLLSSRLDTRLSEFEATLRRKIMKEAEETFAPLSAVLNQGDADSTKTLNEDLILQRLKSHLSTLVDAIPPPQPPREIDEPALEQRVVQKVAKEVEAREQGLEKRLAEKVTKEVDQRERVQALQKRIDALSEEVNAATLQAAHAESLAKSRPSSSGAAPTAIDHSTEIAALAKQLAELRAKDHSAELESLREQVSELRAKPEPTPSKDHTEEIAALEKRIAGMQTDVKEKVHTTELIALEQRLASLHTEVKEKDCCGEIKTLEKRLAALLAEPKPKDHSEEIAALQKQLADLLAQPKAKDHSQEIAELQQRIAELQSLPKSKDHSAEIAAVQQQIADLLAQPEPKDHSTAIAALEKQIADLASQPEPKDHSAAILALEKKIASLTASPTGGRDHSGEIEELERKIQQLSERPEVKAKDHSEEIAQLNEQIAALSSKPSTPAGKDHSTELSSLASELAALRQEIARVQQEVSGQRGAAPVEAQSGGSVDVEAMRREIAQALERYSADRTSRVDYALRSSGGRVLAHSPSNRVPLEGPAWLTWIKQCFMAVRPPEEALNDDMSVGSCWPMAGADGFLTLGLREEIVPTSISLQHVASTVVPDYSTTPKEFTVWGVDDADGQRVAQHTNAKPIGVPLGRFTYVANSTQVQTFQLQPPKAASSRPFSVVTIGFHSNYGNPAYTCVYRVRVHGTPTQGGAAGHA